jgi:hypothetical protein
MRDWLTRFIACSVLSSTPLLAQEADTDGARNSAGSKQTADTCSENCDCGGTESTTKSGNTTSCNLAGDDTDPKSSSPKVVPTLFISAQESRSSQSDWFLSDMLGSWLQSPIRFKTEVAVHFSHDGEAVDHKNLIATVCLENAEQDNKTVGGANQLKSNSGTPLAAKPLEFSTGFEKLVEDVIACGHRICTGNKCYEVKDEPVVGDDCSTTESKEEEEPIMVVPAAPPAPPAMYFTENENAPSSKAGLVDDAVLKELDISGPAKVVMNLLVDNARLSAKLELTETLMAERQAAMEQIYTLAEKNARLQTQIAVNEARQHATEQLTASLIDRTEVAMKLVATRTDSETENSQSSDSNATLKAIQEDLSNIRKQIGLMKRQVPVPFAPSSVGRPQVQPYVPSLQQHGPVETHDPALARDPHRPSKY